jgi:CheY-like chemotaxis protein
MAAVSGIVRAHGGGIAVRSRPDEGTTFEVWLPSTGRFPSLPTSRPTLPDAAPRLATPVDSPRSSVRPAPGPRRALVIDDERAIRDVAMLLLEDVGWEVSTAATGEEGLTSLLAMLPDVVLLDLTMPGMGGAAALAEIRRRWPELPVVIMSGYSEELLADRGIVGVAFLEKPFRGDDLHACLRAAAAG